MVPQLLPSVNPAVRTKLKVLGIHTAEDLLYYFPHRYNDFSNVVAVADLVPGETAAVQGTLKSVKVVRTWQRSRQLLEAELEDESGGLVRIIWFNQLYLLNTLKAGVKLAVAGKAYEGKRGLYFANPAYEMLGKEQIHTGRLVPVYRETKGMTSRWLRLLVKKHLSLAQCLPDALPSGIIAREKFQPLADSLHAIHFPENVAQAEEARRRFQFEELFVYQLKFARERRGRETSCAHAIAFDQGLVKAFVDKLPFHLTDGQRKSAWQVLQDIAKPYPMQRLLEGDVGSGKTIVCFLAALEAVKSGFQVLLMAPTEVLARQHFNNAKKILAPHRITVGLATGASYTLADEHIDEIRDRRLTKKTFYAKLADGGIHIAVGTHALISDAVHCKDLALAIVDEQHRFGVDQRAKLLDRGHIRSKQSAQAYQPHYLSMSATPIPRTLALAVYGDLDISRITEMPKGREAIETKVVLPAKRNEAYAFMRGEVKKGRQVFVICPRIEAAAVPDDRNARQFGADNLKKQSAWSDVKAVKEEYEKLSKTIFPDLTVAMLHGKLTSKEKAAVMQKFAAGECDILVSTSVIEVGIDVPNASVMAIEGADRFGLATLHQFRGRVGRGKHKSYCLLLSDSAGAESNARLKALVTAKNGFELAQIDLELRGPGEFMGGVQSGVPDIAMEALRNPVLIDQVREEARSLFAKDPSLSQYPALREKLDGLGKKVHGE